MHVTFGLFRVELKLSTNKQFFFYLFDSNYKDVAIPVLQLMSLMTQITYVNEGMNLSVVKRYFYLTKELTTGLNGERLMLLNWCFHSG